MKITSSRLDDLRKARSDYDAETQRLSDMREAQSDRYCEATDARRKELAKEVSNMIGPTSLELEIRVNANRYFGSKTYEIRVEANQRNKFADNVALAWEWQIGVNEDGEVVRDSGSWSGLKATTADQLADLEESVRVLRILNNTDWTQIIHAPRPDRAAYIDDTLTDTLRSRHSGRPNFEDDMKEAELEEIIERGNTAIQLKNDSYFRGTCWILPIKMTDKSVSGHIFPDMFARNSIDLIKREDIRRTTKSNLVWNSDSSTFETIKLSQ